MLNKIKKLSVPAVASLFLSSLASAGLPDEAVFRISIDRSSSMKSIRSATGNTLYHDSIEQAKSDLVKAYLQSQGRTLRVKVTHFGQYLSGTAERWGSWIQALQQLEMLQNNPPASGEDNISPVASELCDVNRDVFDKIPDNPDWDMYDNPVYLYRVSSVYTDLREIGSGDPECTDSFWNLGYTWYDMTYARVQSPMHWARPETPLVFNMNVYDYSASLTPPTPLNKATEVMQALSDNTGGEFKGFKGNVVDPVVGGGQAVLCGVFATCP